MAYRYYSVVPIATKHHSSKPWKTPKKSLKPSIHGLFWQRADDHLEGKGCIECAGIKKSSTKELKKAREVHGNNYDYKKVRYKNNYDKVKITCKLHADFLQTPSHHLHGQGCATCAKRPSYTTNSFVKKAKEIHGNKYSYEAVKYRRAHIKITITCYKHGNFTQAPAAHLSGIACPKCAGTFPLSKAEFLKRAKDVHGKTFDYKSIDFIDRKTPISIICKIHGTFTQLPSVHLRGFGCQKCTLKGEGLVSKAISSLGLKMENFSVENRRYDFYLPDLNLIIERDGEQHYENVQFATKRRQIFNEERLNDYRKTMLAIKHGYKIARIPYWVTDEYEILIKLGNIFEGKPTYPLFPLSIRRFISLTQEAVILTPPPRFPSQPYDPRTFLSTYQAFQPHKAPLT